MLVILAFGIVEVIIASTILFSCRQVFGYAYSRDKEVVVYAEEMTPFICLAFIVDGLQAILSGDFLLSFFCIVVFSFKQN